MFFLLLLIKLLPSFSVLFSPGCSCSKLHVDSLSHTVFAFKSTHRIHHEHTQAITRSIAAFVIAQCESSRRYTRSTYSPQRWPAPGRRTIASRRALCSCPRAHQTIIRSLQRDAPFPVHLLTSRVPIASRRSDTHIVCYEWAQNKGACPRTEMQQNSRQKHRNRHCVRTLKMHRSRLLLLPGAPAAYSAAAPRSIPRAG